MILSARDDSMTILAFINFRSAWDNFA